MSVIVVDDDDGNNDDAAEQVAEVAAEVAEAVADSIGNAVAQIVDNEPTSDTSVIADVAFASGVALSEVANLSERIERIEQKLDTTAEVAELALEVAVTEPVVEEPTEVEAPLPEDEPPSTRRNRFNGWFFGKQKGDG